MKYEDIWDIKDDIKDDILEKDGNLEVYATKLERETNGIVEWLNEQSRTITSVSVSELKELLYDFQQKLKLVETKLTNHGTKMEHS